jgi:hypothetical protein
MQCHADPIEPAIMSAQHTLRSMCRWHLAHQPLRSPALSMRLTNVWYAGERCLPAAKAEDISCLAQGRPDAASVLRAFREWPAPVVLPPAAYTRTRCPPQRQRQSFYPGERKAELIQL